jgi:LacI family transcriptional regulator
MSRTEHMEPGADFLRKLAGEGRVDGFLIQRRDETDRRDFAALADGGGRPIVLMNARWARHSSVVHDDEGAGRMATQHLLDLGHRDIALIGGDPHSHTAAARQRGYLQAVHEAGMRKRSGWVLERPYEPEAGHAAMIELCTSFRRRPTAVVVANIHAAIGAMLGAREVGLKIPEQLSIVAIHDWWISDYTRPKLATVRLPQRALGQAAMRLLHERLQGKAPQDLTITEPRPTLIARESTAPPPRRLVRGKLPQTV